MLNVARVRNSKPGILTDGYGGNGLRLRTYRLKNGRTSRTFLQRIAINGTSCTLTIGKYPEVSLAEARERCWLNKRAIREGKDPRAPGIPTFNAVCHEYLESRTLKEATRSKFEREIGRYACSRFGASSIDKITTADVANALTYRSRWTKKNPTMKRVAGYCSQVFRYSIAKGWRQDNPAGVTLKAGLPTIKRRVKHHRAIAPEQAPEAYRLNLRSGRKSAARLALAWIMLTACRSDEARSARWSEIQGRLWIVPASRTKTGSEHRVPLSDAARAILRDAARLFGDTGLIFPSRQGKTLSAQGLGLRLKRLGIDAAPHGFRQTFRNWCASVSIPREIAEQVLGHAVAGVEGHYLTSDLLEQRRDALQRWSSLLTL